MERLRQRADFLAVAGGVKAPAPMFVLQMQSRGEAGPARVGFTVTKRIGGAVERNRIRRRLREVVRLSSPSGMRPGHDYVLIGRRTALSLPFDRLVEDFNRALGRVHAAPAGAGSSGARGGKGPNTTPHAGTR